MSRGERHDAFLISCRIRLSVGFPTVARSIFPRSNQTELTQLSIEAMSSTYMFEPRLSGISPEVSHPALKTRLFHLTERV